ncbi:unnamed protein product, partial [Trichobilharzia szidati]
HQLLYKRRSRRIAAQSAPHEIINKLSGSGFKAKPKHRPSCRHFRPTVRTKPKCDDTADDVSSPSGFLETEGSENPLPSTSVTNGKFVWECR